jgi:hypothetical protein
MTTNEPYETLDPENWDEMRALAHRMVDDAITYLETVRNFNEEYLAKAYNVL